MCLFLYKNGVPQGDQNKRHDGGPAYLSHKLFVRGMVTDKNKKEIKVSCFGHCGYNGNNQCPSLGPLIATI